MNWSAGPLLGFDTETTGVDVWSDRIVTAALVSSSGSASGGGDSRTVDTWLINPGVEIPPEASEIHGITTQYAATYGAAPADALEQIAARIAEHLSLGYPVVAFNAAFDLSLLEAELVRHDLATVTERLGREIRPVLDPLVLDRAVDRFRRGKRKLLDLCGVYEVLDPGALHTADVDVMATLDVLAALAERHPQLLDMSLADLHEYQVSEHRRWARSFNEWRAGQGYTGDPASDEWPLAGTTEPFGSTRVS